MIGKDNLQRFTKVNREREKSFIRLSSSTQTSEAIPRTLWEQEIVQ